MKSSSLRVGLTFLAVVGAAALGGCVDEDIVYVERPLFDDPPTQAQGFVGYSDEEAKRTVCGACHVGQQGRWQETAHADAWATLAATGDTRAFCEACHTVSGQGNDIDGDAGWVATGNPRYHDVQCESCHGPGLDHVTVPDAPGNQPLATISLGANADQSCAECHSGVHRPFAEEWASSGHGDMNAYPQGRPGCQSCHEGKGALRAWGVKSVFSPQDEAELQAITCAVCHDPHDASNQGQLRFALDAADLEQNLCMKCHNQRGEPDLGSITGGQFRGPHAPEGPLLLGTAGWHPPNLEFRPGEILGTHGSTANPRMCAGCHVVDFEMEDPETGDFVFRTTGHTFQATPCVDEDGMPSGAADCGLTERSFRSCTDGCHGSEAAARSALIVAEGRINDLVEDIGVMLDQIPDDQFGDPDRFTTADGSLFNMQLAQTPGAAVHNPFLIEALLRASMRQLEADYGIAAAPSAAIER
ncbi:MAG: cytochrome c3 family protein [Gemmatimonadota bacterium]